jgi:hypothetical protein
MELHNSRGRLQLILWVVGFIILVILFLDPKAQADSGAAPVQPIAPGGGLGGGIGDINFNPEISTPEIAPQEAVFLCPGVGGAAVVLGMGGGYCDFDFTKNPSGPGWNHIHCEWGGASPLISMWNCWTVFPGQPDHPAHQDPRIIPDGMGVPWAILGPDKADQWPPPGLAPAADLIPPPAPEEAPPPGP